uniref:Uncharacterized protein n=1 Tax=Rhizophora mucronata TaxID=61149 RepID=A0A2P2PB84_RHIMU
MVHLSVKNQYDQIQKTYLKLTTYACMPHAKNYKVKSHAKDKSKCQLKKNLI